MIKKLSIKKILKNPFFWILVLLIIIYITVKTVFAVMPYPELDSFIDKKYSTRFYDRKQRLIYVSPLEEGLRREFMPLEKIPENVQKIFIFAEDKRFYIHQGVDFFAAINAYIQNKAAGRTVRGASTLSMQLVKIFEKNRDYSFSQKLKDMINAWRVEGKLSKKQILELYLNSVPFGHSTEGVTSAARLFFNKNLDELNDFEISCLSVIPRRPVDYDPSVYPENNAERACEIYKRLFKVSNKDYVEIKQIIYDVANACSIHKPEFLMPHYMTRLLNQLKQENYDLSYEYYTTTDLEAYYLGENLLKSALKESKGSRIYNASLLVIDNKDNSIVTWIGNPDWSDVVHSGQIDGVLVRNQAGSSMKPFLYALALDQKRDNFSIYTPSTIFPDVPKEFGDENLYIPGNFNNKYNGPVRLRIALASSLNVPAVDLLNRIGVTDYLDCLFDLGFESLRKNGQKADLGLALGAGEVSLYELVNAFSVFPRKGINAEGKRIYSEDTAALICSILSDKAARALGFGYSQTFETSYPSIFKTGTSNQYQSIVALGATTDYTIGVWMGNFHGQTVRGKTGSSLPAFVARKMLDALSDAYDKNTVFKKFDEPVNWTKKEICPLSGLLPGPNCPSTVMEYVEDGTSLGICSWHRNQDGKIKIVYPAEYDIWSRNQNTVIDIDYSSSQLEVVSPKSGAVFYHSERNQDLQAITVQVIGGNSDFINVEYDGKKYRTVERPFSFSLPVEIGKHNFTVTCGTEKITTSFEVK